jgi:L-Ala-D/L-Glu epimerase / N-acetyl-D-glutamate racemase
MVTFQHEAWPELTPFFGEPLVLTEKAGERKALCCPPETRMKPARELSVSVERWPIRGRFTISRGGKHEAAVVVATIVEGEHHGRGECVPYARYGESVEGVVQAIEACRVPIAKGLDRRGLQASMPAGAARNALDCALWDLEAKILRRSAAEIAGLPPLHAVETAFTISLASPDEMAARAREAASYSLLKLKLGGADDEQRLDAVRRAVPHARLIADANESWRASDLERLLAAAKGAGVELIEQPLPAGHDTALERICRVVPICADESVHDRASLAAVAPRYDAVNIKLDKTGGLTEALATAAEARKLGLKLMVGCMVATSLAMAPALLLAQQADFVDLDGPLLLERDRVPGLAYSSGRVMPPQAALWG